MSGGRDSKARRSAVSHPSRWHARASRRRHRQSHVARARSGRLAVCVEPIRWHGASPAGRRSRRAVTRQSWARPRDWRLDADGHLFVGDRIGIDSARVARSTGRDRTPRFPRAWPRSIWPSGPDECLYVAAPTLATHDAVYRITRDRLVDVVQTGFGRPQGLAFDSSGAALRRRCAGGRGGFVSAGCQPAGRRARTGTDRAFARRRVLRSRRRTARGVSRYRVAARWPAAAARDFRLWTDSPLDGLRVLDLSRLLPGAFATLMLAELGAEVIKIEDPRGGDPMRTLPPLLDGRGVYDLLLNRGKKSVALDLRRPESAAVLDRLVATADVVVESFRPRTAKRLGVAGEQFRARYPRRDSLRHHRLWTDRSVCRTSGTRSELRVRVGVARGRSAGSRVSCRGCSLPMLAAARCRPSSGFWRRSSAANGIGVGASLDISMHDAALYWVMLPAARDLVDGGDRVQGELPTFGAHACVQHLRDPRRSADRAGRAGAEILGRVLRRHRPARPGRPARDRCRRSGGARRGNAGAVRSRGRATSGWRLFEGHDVCLTPVNQPAEALRDPHVAARGTVRATRRVTERPAAVRPARAGPRTGAGAGRAHGRGAPVALARRPRGRLKTASY